MTAPLRGEVDRRPREGGRTTTTAWLPPLLSGVPRGIPMASTSSFLSTAASIPPVWNKTTNFPEACRKKRRPTFFD
jgi:hypothetical protein